MLSYKISYRLSYKLGYELSMLRYRLSHNIKLPYELQAKLLLTFRSFAFQSLAVALPW